MSFHSGDKCCTVVVKWAGTPQEKQTLLLSRWLYERRLVQMYQAGNLRARNNFCVGKSEKFAE
jgi:hypothetical protein